MDQHRVRIAGIDPGTARIGFAVIEDGPGSPVLAHAELITLPSSGRAERLQSVQREIENRIMQFKPDAVAVEKLFFSKNVKTALAVAEARGLILATASRHASAVWEIGPTEMKLAVTGYGKTAKAGVRRMVGMLFPRAELPKNDDAIDAIAIALAGLYSHRGFAHNPPANTTCA